MQQFEHTPEQQAAIAAIYEQYKAQGLKLDMSRGKPCREQLDLSDGMYVDSVNLKASDGSDCRNYGTVEGLYEARVLFADLFGLVPEQVMVANNSSQIGRAHV